MPSADAVKLTFRLSEEERGPYPVSTESLWCRPDRGLHRVENIPFFLEGLSFDDLIEVAELEDEPGTYRVASVVEPSGHSTVWVFLQNQEGRSVLDQLVAEGCGREGGVFPDLFALNVPPTVSLQKVSEVLEAASEKGELFADYPSVRQ